MAEALLWAACAALGEAGIACIAWGAWPERWLQRRRMRAIEAARPPLAIAAGQIPRQLVVHDMRIRPNRAGTDTAPMPRSLVYGEGF